jgi:hypothetical protein
MIIFFLSAAIIISIIIISIIITCLVLCNISKSQEVVVPDVSFPFKNLFDEKGNKLNIILISAPFRCSDHDKLYEEYKSQGLDFCGITSYREFPQKIVNQHEDRYHEDQKHNYSKMVKAWIYCFRNPENFLESPSYLPDEQRIVLPKLFLTEADLHDPENYDYDPNTKKEYDFIYVCLKDNDECTDGWQSSARNWDLAKKCLEVMCKDFKLKGILIGRQNCKITEFCDGMLKIVDFLPYHEFQTELKKARFLFVPNIEDSSPRIITEAMMYNIPVLVNENILGGYHNIISGVTGEFFTDENNLTIGLQKITENLNIYTSRDWYIKNRGRKNSGKLLSKFLIEWFPNINNKDMEYAYVR